MPRKSKGARLYYRDGRKGRDGVYVIRDGQREFSTRTGDRAEAEAALTAYLVRKSQPEKNKPLGSTSVAEVLASYGEAKAAPDAKTADPARIGYALSALLDGWGHAMISDVDEASCKAYAAFRREGYEKVVGDKIVRRRAVGDGTIRRELGALRAAVNHCVRQKLLSGAVDVWLPDAPDPKDRWLSRDEAAALIRAARSDPNTRYLSRFILAGLYTGSRKQIILTLKFARHSRGGYVDLNNGRMYRKAHGARKTKKKAPPVQLPYKFLGHLKRWHKMGAKSVVEKNGKSVVCIKNDWERVRERAEMLDVTPHTLRHSAITWAMQLGANVWHVSGYFGVSLDTLEKTYAHHHPQHMQTAVLAANQMGKT